MNRLCLFASFSAVAACAASSAVADYDVAPSVSASKQIVTNAFTDDTEDFVPNVRVFDYGFGEDPLSPFFAQDPGFHPQPGSGLPSGAAVSATVLSGLSYWNGTGTVNFGAVPAGETLRLAKGSGSLTITSSAPTGSLTIDAATPATGEFDQHLESTLLGLGTTDPSTGIYMTTLQLHDSAPGVGDSLPIFIVYNNGLDESLSDEAKVYLRDTFAPGTNLAPLPEPSAITSVLGAVWLLTVRRRRAR
jgi:hypothetical protein